MNSPQPNESISAVVVNTLLNTGLWLRGSVCTGDSQAIGICAFVVVPCHSIYLVLFFYIAIARFLRRNFVWQALRSKPTCNNKQQNDWSKQFTTLKIVCVFVPKIVTFYLHSRV